MPQLRVPNGINQEYSGEEGWIVWAASGQTFKRQGWKLHVFVGAKADAQRTLDIALPIVQQMDTNHKFWASDDPVLDPADTNQGKWFALYPISGLYAMEAARAIEEALQAAAVTPLNADLAGEIKVNLGYVYARYGPYGHDQMLTPADATEADARGVRAHPGWVENIWLHYAALTQPRSRIAVTLPTGFGAEFPDPPAIFGRRKK